MGRHRLTASLSGFFVAAVIATHPVPACAQQSVSERERPRYDAAAPALTIDLVQPAGTRTTWAALKGNAVVLEFWATWCSGCVAAIPHLNELAAKMKDKPVRFISVTDEDLGVVAPFLAQRPIAGWVGIDSRGATFRAYGIEGRPQTALVDADGVLRGIVSPGEVTESVVEQLVAGTLRMKKSRLVDMDAIGTEPNAPLPVLQVLVRPAMPVDEVRVSPGFERRVGTKWEAWGLNLRRMLTYAYDISELWIVLPERLEKPRYDISMTLPDAGLSSRDAMLRQLIAATFAVDVRRETRDADVCVLKTAAGVPPGLQVSEKGRSLRPVVNAVERVFGRPVIDETGLAAKYVFPLAFTGDRQELAAAIRKDLGLVIVQERRPIELLVAEPAVK